MTVLARGGWALSAAFFLLVTSSVLHADRVGWVPAVLILLFVAICARRPASGLEILSAMIPISWYLMHQSWNDTVSWAEVFACAAIAGLSIDAARRADERVPFALRAPALLFALVVISGMVSSVAAKSLALGPAFAGDIVGHVSRAYFFEEAAYPGLHAGMLLLEGVLLFVLAVRISGANPRVLARVAGGTAAGAALAGMINVAKLMQSALRSDAVLPAIVRLSRTVRWNVEYGDYNAAGSFFVMALFVAAALIVASASRRRWWTVCAIVIATALWLTGSRAAYVAGVLAVAAAYLARWTRGSARKRWVTAAALGCATIAVIAVIAFASPRRGNQGSSLAAADIRLRMAMVGARMIASRPAYGIGLGEFHQRSGAFGTWDLYFAFPVSLNENAHNNFVQVAAELGLLGGVPFAWLVGAGLLGTARAARKKDEAGDVSGLLIFAGVSAFVITWLAGHPLLVREPGYVFWIVFGAAAGAAGPGRAPVARGAWWWLTALAAAAIVVAAPFHARAMMDDAELEHVGFGLSAKWLLSPDEIRYRAAQGHGVVFVPAGSALSFSVNPRTDRPVRLELRLEDRVADVITLAPRRWNDVTLPQRADRKAPRFIPMELRVLDGDQIEIWLTKVRPVDGR
jgi:hypothetical protein